MAEGIIAFIIWIMVSLVFVITLLGSLADIVALMAVYVLVIEKKYCRK